MNYVRGAFSIGAGLIPLFRANWLQKLDYNGAYQFESGRVHAYEDWMEDPNRPELAPDFFPEIHRLNLNGRYMHGGAKVISVCLDLFQQLAGIYVTVLNLRLSKFASNNHWIKIAVLTPTALACLSCALRAAVLTCRFEYHHVSVANKPRVLLAVKFMESASWYLESLSYLTQSVMSAILAFQVQDSLSKVYHEFTALLSLNNAFCTQSIFKIRAAAALNVDFSAYNEALIQRAANTITQDEFVQATRKALPEAHYGKLLYDNVQTNASHHPSLNGVQLDR